MDVHELSALLESLYGTRDALPRLLAVIEKWRVPIATSFETDRRRKPRFDQRTAVLISYGDHMTRAGEAPLHTLAQWCRTHLKDLVTTVHVLPFHPSTSYEGYSITDYAAVDPAFGSWSDIAELHEDFDIMTDLVLNHCSQEHPWFKQFLRDEEPGRRYFIAPDDPQAPWLRGVHRARTSPLLSTFETVNGPRHVWTTYDRDLVDLNWSEPDLAIEVVDILLESVARGMRIVRLDAFVYVWKKINTTCVNQPQVRDILRLLQRALDAAGASAVAILPSLTNVTQAESFTFLGDVDGDRKADLIYHLPLSALLLQALYAHDASTLAGWLRELPAAPKGSAYLNLTACHDGVGLTWLRDVLPEKSLTALIDTSVTRGSLVSWRRQTVGDELKPWEINATYFSACGEQVDPFLATQSVLLALRGVPALYTASLVAGRNDYGRVVQSGDNRAINRGRYDVAHWEAQAAHDQSPEARVLGAYQSMLKMRAASRAFHPDGDQRIIDVGHKSVLAIERTSIDGSERVLCVTSFADAEVQVTVDGQAMTLAPYQYVWRNPVRPASAPAIQT